MKVTINKATIIVAFLLGFGLGLLVHVNDTSGALQPTPAQQYNQQCLVQAASGCPLVR